MILKRTVIALSIMGSFAVAYGEMFSKAQLFPKALTILGATAEVNNQNASRTALELYKGSMGAVVNEENGFLSDEKFVTLHEQSLKEALDLFRKRATMGDKEKIQQHLETLEANIEAEHQRYLEENKARDPIAWLATYIVYICDGSHS